MVSRCILIVIFLTCRRCLFLVEQPSDSKLDNHNRWEWMEKLFEYLNQKYPDSVIKWIFRYVFAWPGLFGHERQKGTKLWGTVPWISKMKRVMTKAERSKFAGKGLCETVYKDGQKKVYGRKSEMKSSSSYPKGFTDFVTYQYRAHQDDLRAELRADYDRASSSSDYEHFNSDTWSDAHLETWARNVQAAWVNKGPGCPI